MSTAKRLVLSLRGRKHSQGNTATSSTRLVSAGTSPGHELDEIAVVSGTGGSSHHLSSYGGIGADISNGPRYSTDLPPTSPISGYFHSHNDEQRILDADEPEASGQATSKWQRHTHKLGKPKHAHLTTTTAAATTTIEAITTDADNQAATGNSERSAPHTSKAKAIKSKTKRVIFKAKTASIRRLKMSNNIVGKNIGGAGGISIGSGAGAGPSSHLQPRNYFSLNRQPQNSQRPRASFPEIMQPRLSLNGTLRHLVPSPRPLYRDHSSRSIQPLTANEQQLAELDGSFYGNTLGCFSTGGSGGGGNRGGAMGAGGSRSGFGGGGESNTGFHTTELSITPTLTGDEQYIDLGSLRRFSIDRQSFLDLGSKFSMPQPKFGQSVSQQGFFTSHDSLATPCASRASNPHVATVSTASEMDLLHSSNKQRRKSRGRLKTMSGEQPLLDSWQRSATARSSQDNTLAGGLAGSNQFSGNFCNGTDRYPRSRSGTSTTTAPPHSGPSQSHQSSHQLHHSASVSHAHHQPSHASHLSSTQQQQSAASHHQQQPHRTASQRFRAATASRKFHFVFDPAGRLCYYWSMVVSLAFLYNFWVIIYRFAFQEINRRTIAIWFCLDYFSDFLYLIDIFFHFRTGYLEDGVLQTDATKLRQHYMNSTTFYIDCLCLLPLDFLYLSIGFNSILRSFRLVKIYRFWAFMDRTERHTNYPNLFRSTALIHYLLVIFHWNGCLYHIIHKNNGFGSRNWVYHDSESADVVKQYLQSYYWCTLALTTIGDLPKPRSKGEYVFVILQLLFGLMLFATVLGHVANIVTSVSAARKEFQAKLDGVKTYMRMRRVPNHLQVKVIKWFDYLWLTQKCSDEERAVSCLPDKLKAEIAINVHLDTLKRVEIFQNTEAGFLCELVLRLRPVLFSPGDYICRKGEVGKEMYIVNRGRLQVVADNGKTVMASLKAGSYFGEISILNMGTAGNRRTASVRSVGYSDLFVLSKKDMWDVLKEYPAARVRLESIAVKRLEKYKKAPLEKVAMGRCQSTPGLVESCGRTTLEDMWLPPPSALSFAQQQQIQQQQQQQQSVSYSRAPSPRSTITYTERITRATDSPGSVSPSVHSSDDRPRSRATSHHSTRLQSQPSRTGHICDSSSHLECYGGGLSAASGGIGGGGTTPLLGSHEALEDEIKRLRERLHTVESENQALNTKLSQQQWDLENRLAEIEMQICGVSSTSSLDPENETEEMERNRESII